MRLRQLLAVITAIMLSSVLAAAAGSQLKDVGVVAHGNSTLVTMQATGTFEHNEYKSGENLLLVDMAGVSAGKMHGRERSFRVPGVESYRVIGYKGAGGMDVARLELHLAPGADARVSDIANGVEINVSPKSGSVAVPAGPATASAAATHASSTSAPALLPQSDGPASTGMASAVSEPVMIRQISVARTTEGMEVEIAGSGPMKGSVLTLKGPHRIVVDVPNAVPGAKPKPIQVNSGDVKAVRMAQYQAAPPVTRVVIDLTTERGYELSNAGNTLILKVRPAGYARNSVSAVPAASKQSAEPVLLAMNEKGASSIPVPVSNTSSASAQEKPVAGAQAPTVVAQTVATPIGKQAKGDSEQAPAQAQPFAFVEPKYTPAVSSQPAVTAQNDAPREIAPKRQPEPENRQQAAAAKLSVNFAAEQREQREKPYDTTPAPKYTGEPISVNLKDVDVKDFFRLIHEISGLNIVLDPSVNGKVTLVLDDVPWDQALDIVLKNNGLDRELQGNVLRIASVESLRKEAQDKRLQLEAQALAVEKVNVTRFLSYAHAKDVMPTIKKMLSARGDIVADERTNALVIQDIPSVIPEIDRLLSQLDRKTMEVEIEARVIAATRTFARDIGAQVGFGTGSNSFAVGGGTSTNSTLESSGLNPSYIVNKGTNGQTIPLFSNLLPTTVTSGLSFINATNAYRLDVVLGAAESRGLLKILSRPRVVTQNNVQALVKQGYRIPTVTLGQLGGPPTVTYIEAVLRLTVTPQITVENTIFLNVDIENTTPDFSREVYGNPVFLTQQATTQVLVTDGGTVMIGGVIQTNNSVTVDQVPYLGSVPILGNLFKRRSVNNSTQELIFILTPKIVQT